MNKDDVKPFFQGFGLAISLIVGIATIAKFFSFDPNHYLNTNMFKVIGFLFVFIYPFILGYIIAVMFKNNNQLPKLTHKNDNYIQQVLKRESKAQVIWIVIKKLNFDINHPKYIEVLKKNLSKKVKYRYIINKDKNTKYDLISYKDLYNLEDNDIEQMFLVLDNSDMIKFLRHITIYDPYTPKAIAYFYPHNISGESEWYITFNNDKSIEYTNLFRSVWLENKGKLPS